MGDVFVSVLQLLMPFARVCPLQASTLCGRPFDVIPFLHVSTFAGDLVLGFQQFWAFLRYLPGPAPRFHRG